MNILHFLTISACSNNEDDLCSHVHVTSQYCLGCEKTTRFGHSGRVPSSNQTMQSALEISPCFRTQHVLECRRFSSQSEQVVRTPIVGKDTV